MRCTRRPCSSSPLGRCPSWSLRRARRSVAELAHPLVATFLLTRRQGRPRCSVSSWTTSASTGGPSRSGRTTGAASRRGPRGASFRSALSSPRFSGPTFSVRGLSAAAGCSSRRSRADGGDAGGHAEADRPGGGTGWLEAGEIRHRIFRHTYTAARLQTLDRGAPVSLYTVSRELGPRIGGDGAPGVLRTWARSGTARRWWSTGSSSTSSGSEIGSSGWGLTQRMTQIRRAGDGNETPAPTEVRSGGRASGVGPARLERATSCSGGKRSIQLSYGPV